MRNIRLGKNDTTPTLENSADETELAETEESGSADRGKVWLSKNMAKMRLKRSVM
jgi:hypothetical protein